MGVVWHFGFLQKVKAEAIPSDMDEKAADVNLLPPDDDPKNEDDQRSVGTSFEQLSDEVRLQL